MATTREIPREDWSGFLDAFTRRHAGETVQMEIFGTDFGAQEESQSLPLIGVSGDFKDAGRERITIAVGRSAEDHVSHSVLRPKAIRLLQNDQGTDEALEIEPGEGAPTLLRIPPPGAEAKTIGRETATARPDRR
ncbi:MAG TPA: DUF5335 family protein [Thermoanaerobaculia bacterium]|nr:DUF5335 family protein [Thermoanaerobaculia bacterium]